MPLTRADLDFARRALALKRTVRAGWTRVPGLIEPESVADHSFGVALLALLAAARDPTLNAGRILRVALVHDLAEAVVGDLTPHDVSSAMEKRAIEERGMQELVGGIDYSLQSEIGQAWREYEDGETREARLVRDLDKVEMALQAVTYAEEGADPDALREFHESAVAKCADPHLGALLRAFAPARVRDG